MYFTREDILKILKALLLLGIKDSEFKAAHLPLLEDDTITIVQNNVNRKVKVSNIIGQFNILNRQDFINVSDMYDEHYITISEAIKLLPERKRKAGLVITFQNTNGDWQIYLFEGTVDLFINDSYWKDLFDFKYPIIDSVLPDEEDLTLTYPDNSNNSFIKLKDKEYNLDNFSGLGKVILRKNIVEVEDPTYGKIKKNILYQDMINKSNTIYVIQYDFTLGENITVPENCVLEFDGGSLSNGTLIDNTLHTFIINNSNNVILNNIILQGGFKGIVYSSWVYNDDEHDIFANIIKFDEVFLENDIHLSKLSTPMTSKSLYLQGINNPTIYTNFEDDEIQGNGVNCFRIATPMGAAESNLTIKDINIIDQRFEVLSAPVKSMHGGIFVFPHDPNTSMRVVLENITMKNLGDCLGFSHEQDASYTYDGEFYLYVNNCNIECNQFCIETYKPGDVKEMYFNNSIFTGHHSFRPELSLGTHAVAGQNREAYIYVNNCVFGKGIENGIHNYWDNTDTKYIVEINNCIFNNYHYVSERSPQISGEGVEVTANNCIFKNDNSLNVGTVSGGEKIEFNDCSFKINYSGNNYPMFNAINNIFRRCYFTSNTFIRFYGNYINGDPLLYNNIIFDSCIFDNITILISRFAESIKAGMNYQIKNCKFLGNSSIRHWDTTDFRQTEKFFNTETSFGYSELGQDALPYWNDGSGLKTLKELTNSCDTAVFNFKGSSNKCIKLGDILEDKKGATYHLSGVYSGQLIDYFISIYVISGNTTFQILCLKGGQYFPNVCRVTHDSEGYYFEHLDNNFEINLYLEAANIKYKSLVPFVADRPVFNMGYRDNVYHSVLSKGLLKGTLAEIKASSKSFNTGDAGCMSFATDLADGNGKPVWYNGTTWVDATGTTV